MGKNNGDGCFNDAQTKRPHVGNLKDQIQWYWQLKTSYKSTGKSKTGNLWTGNSKVLTEEANLKSPQQEAHLEQLHFIIILQTRCRCGTPIGEYSNIFEDNSIFFFLITG